MRADGTPGRSLGRGLRRGPPPRSGSATRAEPAARALRPRPRSTQRRYDRAGTGRDSDGVTGRVGAEIELTRLLTGEASAGWQVRDYESPNRDDVAGAGRAGRGSSGRRPRSPPSSLTGESPHRGDERRRRARRPGAPGEHRDLAPGAAQSRLSTPSLSWAGTDYEGTALTEELIAANRGPRMAPSLAPSRSPRPMRTSGSTRARPAGTPWPTWRSWACA